MNKNGIKRENGRMKKNQKNKNVQETGNCDFGHNLYDLTH